MFNYFTLSGDFLAIVRAESEKGDSTGLGYGDEHCLCHSEGVALAPVWQLGAPELNPLSQPDK